MLLHTFHFYCTLDGSKATAAPAAVSLIPAECKDFAVFGTSAIAFAEGNTVNGGNAGSNTINAITGPAITQESPFTKVGGPVTATIDCAAAIAAAVDAFQAATPGGNYTTFATATLQDKSPIKPGSYYSAATLSTAADNDIVFDAENDANAIFILQAASTLGTGARTKFTFINGAKAENIYWQVGTAATIGAGTVGVGHSFVGTIIAGTAITMGADVTVYGRLLAETAVTMAVSNIVDPFGVVVPPSARFLRH